jgi:hypothetical protein
MNARTVVVVLVALATGSCARLRSRTQPTPSALTAPPPKPTTEEIAASCKTSDPNPSDDKSETRAYVIDCPLDPSLTSSDVIPGAIHRAAILAAFLEAEEFLALNIADPPAGLFRISLFYAPANKTDFFDRAKVDGSPEFVLLKTADVLSPRVYDEIKEKVEITKENKVYAQCKTLVLDIDASTREPARAAACSNTMVVVDRNRMARQSKLEAERESQRRLDELNARRQENERLLAQQAEHDREMENLERRRAVGDALRQMGESFKPKPTYETECRETYGYGRPVRCTTTQK